MSQNNEQHPHKKSTVIPRAAMVHASAMIALVMLLAFPTTGRAPHQVALADVVVPNARKSEKPYDKGVRNLGAINSFTVSDKWKPHTHVERATSYCYVWHHVNDPGAVLSVSWSGPRMPAESASRAIIILTQKPHSLTPAEISSLKGVLRAQAEPDMFKVDTAATKDIDGQRVIVISGVWLNEKMQHENNKTESIYIRSSTDGTVFQQVGYTASEKKFPTYYDDAKAALDSLRVADRTSSSDR